MSQILNMEPLLELIDMFVNFMCIKTIKYLAANDYMMRVFRDRENLSTDAYDLGRS